MLLEALEQAIQTTVHAALEEDIGDGDLTARLIPEIDRARGRVISRQQGVLCGTAWFVSVFRILDESSEIHWHVHDGDDLAPDQVLCELSGNTRALLTGERTALNFLQTLSGTATLARQYAEAVRKFPDVKVLDTRKTVPGLRAAQKYAVVTGGCHNHRMGLYDGILIKENHIAANGSVAGAVQAARTASPGMPVEIEVQDTDQLREALTAGADVVLLDNFDIDRLREAVAINNGRAQLEASGGIDLDNITAVAATGVDRISIGALTKDVHALDLSMTVQPVTD